MVDKGWSNIDFQLNKQFWKYWGPEAALPFRIDNLVELQNVLADRAGINSSLYGTTLKHAMTLGRLDADHDDDIVVSPGKIEKTKTTIMSLTPALGFQIIREEPELVSVERDGRYVDIRSSPLSLARTIPAQIHGAHLAVAENYAELLDDKYGEGKWRQPAVIPISNEGRPNSSHTMKSRLSKTIAKISSNAANRPKVEGFHSSLLSEAEFLALEIDAPDALNWDWRGSHLERIFRSGETLAGALDRLRNVSASTLLAATKEIDTSVAFPEPMNISRRFWRSGSNHFVYPFIYGLRHRVVPYAASNLYILSKKRPFLYTKEYFESLPQMTAPEIVSFLDANPIELSGNCLSSGRHRATAMLGRLWRGEGYLPMRAQRQIGR